VHWRHEVEKFTLTLQHCTEPARHHHFVRCLPVKRGSASARTVAAGRVTIKFQCRMCNSSNNNHGSEHTLKSQHHPSLGLTVNVACWTLTAKNPSNSIVQLCSNHIALLANTAELSTRPCVDCCQIDCISQHNSQCLHVGLVGGRLASPSYLRNCAMKRELLVFPIWPCCNSFDIHATLTDTVSQTSVYSRHPAAPTLFSKQV
jgi:hypothetical protein